MQLLSTNSRPSRHLLHVRGRDSSGSAQGQLLEGVDLVGAPPVAVTRSAERVAAHVAALPLPAERHWALVPAVAERALHAVDVPEGTRTRARGRGAGRDHRRLLQGDGALVGAVAQLLLHEAEVGLVGRVPVGILAADGPAAGRGAVAGGGGKGVAGGGGDCEEGKGGGGGGEGSCGDLESHGGAGFA